MTPKIMYYILLGIIGVLVIAGAGAYYVSHERLQTKITRLEQSNADTVLARERLNNLQKLEQSYDQISPLEDKMARMLPYDKKQSQVAAKIYTMIDSAGLKGSSITFESTEGMPDTRSQTAAGDVENVRIMPVNFSVQGSYQQLQTFLNKIERQERLMQVTSLSIQHSSEENELSFNIRLEVFVSS